MATKFTPELLTQIATSQWRENQLDLSGNRNRLNEKEVSALCEALIKNTFIKELKLERCGITASMAKMLAKTTLTALDVSVNQIGDEGAIALAANKTLKKLNVSNNQIGMQGTEALSATTTLKELDMGGNGRLSLRTMINLAANTALTSLGIASSCLNDSSVSLLMNETLSQLNVCHNEIGDEGAITLAASTTLRKVNLSHNKVGLRGAKALAANTTFEELDIGVNEIGDEGAIVFATSTLKVLAIYYNKIGPRGAKALAANANFQELDIRGNKIGDEGAIVLATSKTLNKLDINNNEIKDTGAIALVANTTFVELDITENEWIGATNVSGLVATLIANKTLTKLHEDIDRYDITDANRAKIETHLANNQRIRENWLELAPLIAFVRANRTSKIKTSFLPLVTEVAALADEKYQNKCFRRSVNWSKFFDTRFFRQVVYEEKAFNSQPTSFTTGSNFSSMAVAFSSTTPVVNFRESLNSSSSSSSNDANSSSRKRKREDEELIASSSHEPSTAITLTKK
jgi:Leucine-rich repeat (LRR) protein